MRRAASLLGLLALAGCGSAPTADLPPPAGPARSPALSATPEGRIVPGARLPPQPGTTAVVERRARALRLGGEEAPAGVGPTHVVSDGGELLYVTDTAGDGVLVFHTEPRLELTRRVALPGGGPYAIAIDAQRDRLWVTLPKTNEVAELHAGPRPSLIRRHASVRQPDDIAVDERTGAVFVAGAGGAVQRLDRRTR